MYFAVKNDISLEVTNGLGIGADARSLVERLQVGVEIEAGLLVKGANLLTADRAIQLFPVIDPRVPGDIALGAKLEFCAKRTNKPKIHSVLPPQLVCFLACKIGGRGLRRQRCEPPR